MKVTGLNGKGVGKLGKEVYSVNHGVQIRREYNAEVSNPSTDGQVGQRSRFKLASQLSAAMQDVIVMPRKALSSPRNQFVKRNIGFIYGSNSGATASYENFQLTNGSLSIPGVHIERTPNVAIRVRLIGNASKIADKIVYNAFIKTNEGKLQLFDSVVISEPGIHGDFVGTLTETNEELVIYAYGIKARTDRAKAAYANYTLENGTDVARLIASQKYSASDFVLTETRGNTLAMGQTETVVVPENSRRLFLTEGTGMTITGTVTDGSVSNRVQPGLNIVPIGASVVVHCEEADGYMFAGWFINGQQEPIERNSTYGFTMGNDIDLVASGWYTGGGLE